MVAASAHLAPSAVRSRIHGPLVKSSNPMNHPRRDSSSAQQGVNSSRLLRCGLSRRKPVVDPDARRGPTPHNESALGGRADSPSFRARRITMSPATALIKSADASPNEEDRVFLWRSYRISVDPARDLRLRPCSRQAPHAAVDRAIARRVRRLCDACQVSADELPGLSSWWVSDPEVCDGFLPQLVAL